MIEGHFAKILKLNTLGFPLIVIGIVIVIVMDSIVVIDIWKIGQNTD